MFRPIKFSKFVFCFTKIKIIYFFILAKLNILLFDPKVRFGPTQISRSL